MPEKIKENRLKNEWTQEDLAGKLNVTRQTISKWEQGINEPDIKTIQSLCQVFKISISELLEEQKNRKNTFLNLCKKLNYVSFSIFLICFFLQLIFLVYVKDQIPLHFNSKHEVDRYGSKWEWLWMLIYYISLFVSDIVTTYFFKKEQNPKRAVYITFVLVKITMWILQLLGLGIYLYFTVSYLVNDCFLAISMASLYLFLLPLVFFAHPKFTKKNSIYGVRTSFTLENEEGWNKINAFSAYVLSITCLILMILNMLISNFWFNMLSSLGLVLALGVIFIYHFVIKKRIEQIR